MKKLHKPKIVILGAGPCGIGAGWCLHKINYPSWKIYEKNEHAGGLSASFRDNKGFNWDIGGHVLFFEHKEFKGFFKEILGDNFISHNRNSQIRIANTYIPYPFQNNLRMLPKELRRKCAKGLKEEKGSKAKNQNNFKEWLEAHFGSGICRNFMYPMNEKMWSYPLDKMSFSWIKKSISLADRQGSTGWGQNARFFYPANGGIGGLFARAAMNFTGNLNTGCELTGIDAASKKLYFKNGLVEKYDALVSTINLRSLIGMINPKQKDFAGLSSRLKTNKLFIIGIGLRVRNPDKRSWIYFPEKKYPFFRVTHLSNYSPENVPCADIGQYSSLLVELSFREGAKINKKLLIQKTISGLIESGLISDPDKDSIVSIFSLEVEHGYPIPTLDREETLKILEKRLTSMQIFSRGRFGSFRYEYGNMDNCFMQGLQTARDLST